MFTSSEINGFIGVSFQVQIVRHFSTVLTLVALLTVVSVNEPVSYNTNTQKK